MTSRVLAGVLVLWVCSTLNAQMQVIFADGEVEYRSENGSTWKAVTEGGLVPENGYVRTGADGVAELLRKDKARLLLSANTLAHLKFSSNPRQDRILIHTGKILTDVFAPGTTLQIRSQSTTMGVRGTRFAVIANADGESQVAVDEGSVFALGRTTDGDASGVLVQAGQKAAASLLELPSASPVRAADREYFDLGAFASMAQGKVPDLFDHYAAQDDAFFRAFTERDLADYQLFLLDEMDDQWEYFLQDRREFLEQLETAPLRGKK